MCVRDFENPSHSRSERFVRKSIEFLLTWMTPQDTARVQSFVMGCAAVQIAAVAVVERSGDIPRSTIDMLMGHCIQHVSREVQCTSDCEDQNVVVGSEDLSKVPRPAYGRELGDCIFFTTSCFDKLISPLSNPCCQN